MKISIAMAYYNRLAQFTKTLETIALSKHKDLLEIIVMDDGSDEESKADKVVVPEGLDVKIFYIPGETRTWINPCIPYNMAFKKVTGDIVIIQNPECMHLGNIIDYVLKNSTEENYISFAALSVLNNALTPEDYEKIASIPVSEVHPYLVKYALAWHNHKFYRPYAYHFLTAITRNNLEALKGFDERYGPGYCFDDNEFVARIKRKGLRIDFPSENEFIALHQCHSHQKPKRFPSLGPLHDRNHKLFLDVTQKETTWSADHNTIYPS